MTDYCSKTGTEIDPSVINLEKPRKPRKPRASDSRPRTSDHPKSPSLLRNLGNSISIFKSRSANGFRPKKSGSENVFRPKSENGFRPKEINRVNQNQDWSTEETDKGTRILKHRVSGVAMELYNATKDPETATPIKGPNTKVSSPQICDIFQAMLSQQEWSVLALILN